MLLKFIEYIEYLYLKKKYIYYLVWDWPTFLVIWKYKGRINPEQTEIKEGKNDELVLLVSFSKDYKTDVIDRHLLKEK